MALQALPQSLPGLRPLTAQEQLRRAAALACVNSPAKPDCKRNISIGIFFDGTNNNKKRDQENISSPLKRSHTNVVVLHDAYRYEPKKGFFKIYIPGVGTPFPEIGEHGELPSGKSMGEGGDARINWALIQVLNAMHEAITGGNLFSEAEARRWATRMPMHAGGTGSNAQGKADAFAGLTSGAAIHRHGMPNPRLAYQLAAALKKRLPMQLEQVNLSVFGFSRGAAAARAFCHFLDQIMQAEAKASWRGQLGLPSGGGRLAGVPLRVQFLGLFDTVCSVGLADSAPGFDGFGGWANDTQDIPAMVERSVHFVAAHELRQNFPLSSSRIRKSYPANNLEVVYPGAHSDVGGGYPCNSQGKARGSRSRLLSQVPLVNMYMEAVKSGVPLMTVEDLRKKRQFETIDDLKVHPETAQLFAAYAKTVSVRGGTVEKHCQTHIQWLWRWLEICSNLEPYALQQRSRSYKDAEAQDRIDMGESWGDYQQDRQKVLRVNKPASYISAPHGHAMQNNADMVQKGQNKDEVRQKFLEAASKAGLNTVAQRDYFDQYGAGTVQQGLPKDVEQFFDTLVHDSHATFYMVGPITDADQRELVNKIRTRQREGKKLNSFEQRVLAHQRSHPGKVPLLSDADLRALKEHNDLKTNVGLKTVNVNTRRESGGHIRYRRVFDKS